MKNFPASLLHGYTEFLDGRFAAEHERYHALAEHGQTPKIMMVACSDSRAAPETIFNAGPSEIFVVRNVANLVPERRPDGEDQSVSAALEFAVNHLKVEHIVVLGHARCGGISAALALEAGPKNSGDFIGKWMQPLHPITQAVLADTNIAPADQQTALEREAIKCSLANLRGFPTIVELEQAGKIHLHGSWFNIANGELWVLDPAIGDFARASR